MSSLSLLVGGVAGEDRQLAAGSEDSEIGRGV